MKVTTLLVLSLFALSQLPHISASCTCASHIPANIAPLLDCVPHLNATCLGEEVKCLRSNLVNRLQLSNLTGTWDNPDTFFNPQLAKVRHTYQNKSHTPCPWTYEAEQDTNRFPQYIQNVMCSSTTCYNSAGVEGGACACVRVKYNMPILRRTKCNSEGQHWEVDSAIVHVACVPRFFNDY